MLPSFGRRAFPWKSEKPPETPHIHPLYDRLLRHEPVDPGPARELPYYTPVDFLQQPAVVHSLPDAVAALRHCDRLCTLIAVQNHTIKNTAFLKMSLIEHTFTQLLPLPKPESDAQVASCIWRTELVYAEQLDMLLLLQRIIEHFAASVFACDHTMPLDASRMVQPTELKPPKLGRRPSLAEPPLTSDLLAGRARVHRRDW